MTEVRLKMRGTTAECDGTKSQLSHLVHDTQRNNLRIYDGIKMGGHEILNKTNLTAHVLGMFADPLTTVYNADRLGGQLPSYYLNASNISSGTLDNARLPAQQTGKTFSSTVWIKIANAATPGGYLIAEPLDYGVGKPRFYISKPTAILDRWDIGLYDTVAHDGTINVVASALTRKGFTVWDSNNDGAGSGLDADLLDGQHGSYYTNASNFGAGTLPAGRLTGSYTGITGVGALAAGSIVSTFGNINIGSAVFTGNGSGLTSLNASNLASGTLPDARLAGAYSMSALTLSSSTALTVPTGGSICWASTADRIVKVGSVYYFYNSNVVGSALVEAGGFRTHANANISLFGDGGYMSYSSGLYYGRTDGPACYFNRSNNGIIISFFRGDVYKGNISVDTSQVTFNQTSDRRLKEDDRPIDTAVLSQLRPVDFRWIESGSRDIGFIAQEVHEVFPLAAKHDTEENRDLWTVDLMKFIPLLTAVAQEQRAQIQMLITRIEQLERLIADSHEGAK